MSAENELHDAICNAVILLNNGEETAPEVSAILRTALAKYNPAPPVVGEVVAWAVDRAQDQSFPRIFATEVEADRMVACVTINPPATKRAVIGYEAVKAALTAALGKGEW